MDKKKRKEITTLAKKFAKTFETTIGKIAGSEFLIVDPMSGYFTMCEIEHKVLEIPRKGAAPQILILEFPDGNKFIPAGSDLGIHNPEMKDLCHDWMWLDN